MISIFKIKETEAQRDETRVQDSWLKDHVSLLVSSSLATHVVFLVAGFLCVYVCVCVFYISIVLGCFHSYKHLW